MKLAILYAGQGSQHPGMGKDLYERYPAFREAFNAADLDFDLESVCFDDPEGVLNLTQYTQPCMVAFAAGVTAVLKENGVKADYLAGLSLGEYSALEAAGVFTAKQAVELAAFRGKAMADAAKGIECGMTAVMNLDRDALAKCCEEASALGCVQICNYNCPGQIVIGSGAEYLYGLIVQLLGRERVFALEDPSYDKIRRVYQAHGVTCEMLRLGSDGIRSDELTRASATVLHVTPFHSFPSQVTASAGKRREYLRWAEERGGYIVEDDFDSEFSVSSKSEDTLFSLEPNRSVIYMNTFSKTIAPSMRVGYMVLPPALSEQFRREVGFYSCTVPVFEQYVLAELIGSGDFERHINRIRRRRRKE